jgi:phosphomevalonate kinase
MSYQERTVGDTVVSAPGKVFLMGEYVVLAGGTAVVAAIDRRVTGRFVPGGNPSSPLVAEVARMMPNPHLPPGAPEIDSGALLVGERKLGLGSSAATAATAAGALALAQGWNIEARRSAILSIAMSAHRAAQQGRGSGADVAASVLGGIIAFSRPPGAEPSIRSLPPLPCELVVFSTGSPSPTVDHLRAVERLAEHDRDTYVTRMTELRVAAETFLRGYQAGDTARLIAAAAAAGTTLDALGRDADFPIVIPALGFAAKLARELGGAAKPSGAGGGDVGVAFFADAEAASAFRNRVPPLGVEILSITTTARGLDRGP